MIHGTQDAYPPTSNISMAKLVKDSETSARFETNLQVEKLTPTSRKSRVKF